MGMNNSMIQIVEIVLMRVRDHLYAPSVPFFVKEIVKISRMSYSHRWGGDGAGDVVCVCVCVRVSARWCVCACFPDFDITILVTWTLVRLTSAQSLYGLLYSQSFILSELTCVSVDWERFVKRFTFRHPNLEQKLCFSARCVNLCHLNIWLQKLES
jgi:hypothetical protein